MCSSDLFSALGEQKMPVRVGTGVNTILVDATTRATLQSVMEAARAAGFMRGDAMLDFTDSPGLVYALGGRPLGSPWLLGGYGHSQALAARVIAQLSSDSLQGVWVLSSDDSPRAIVGWQQMLDTRLGAGALEQAVTVRIQAPYRRLVAGPDSVDVQVWKPRAP